MFGGFIAVFKTMYAVCNDNRVVDTIIPESYDVFFLSSLLSFKNIQLITVKRIDFCHYFY